MKSLNIQLFLSLFLYLSSNASAVTIEKISENFYVGRHDDGLFFGMERVTDRNIDKWQAYVRTQENAAINWSASIFSGEQRIKELKSLLSNFQGDAKERFSKLIEEEEKEFLPKKQKFEPLEKIVRGAGDPLTKMGKCLNYHNRAAVWVIYAMNKKPEIKDEFEKDELKHIEMAMTVLNSDKVPFELHMGISRGIEFLKHDQRSHKGLSNMMHAVAARIMKSINSNIKFLITTPLPNMRDIIVAALQKENYQIGYNFDGSLISQTGEDSRAPNFEFTLKDWDGTTIFSANTDLAANTYRWFFLNIQPSVEHPYLIVNIESLAKLAE